MKSKRGRPGISYEKVESAITELLESEIVNGFEANSLK